MIPFFFFLYAYKQAYSFFHLKTMENLLDPMSPACYCPIFLIPFTIHLLEKVFPLESLLHYIPLFFSIFAFYFLIVKYVYNKICHLIHF